MIAANYYAVTGQQVTTIKARIDKLEVTLNANATAGLFFQVHDTYTTAAEGAVPLRSWPAGECIYKEFKRELITCANGVYICLSSTAGTKTLAVGGNDKIDILQVELETSEMYASKTLVGDLTTNQSNLAVWTANGEGRKLFLFLITQLVAADYYVMLFGDVAADGSTPIMSWAMPTAKTSLLCDFGREGRQVIGTSDKCYIYVSSTQGVLTASTGCAIRALISA